MHRLLPSEGAEVGIGPGVAFRYHSEIVLI